MVRLPLLAALLSALLVAPSFAAPLIVTVPGGTEDEVPPPFFHKPNPHTPPQIWQNPLYRNFNPGDAVMDANLHTPWSHYDYRAPQMSDETVTTYIVTGDSFASHTLKCQHAYASYSIVDDSYLVNGVPTPCRL